MNNILQLAILLVFSLLSLTTPGVFCDGSFAAEAVIIDGTWQDALKYLRNKGMSLAFRAKDGSLEYYRMPAGPEGIVRIQTGPDCAKIGDDDVKLALRWFSEVRELSLWGKNITDASLLPLPSLKRLAVLELHYVGATADGYAAIPKIRALKRLALNSNHDAINAIKACLRELGDLESLDMQSAGLTQNDTEAIRRLVSLRELNLSENWITDKGLDAIADLIHLRKLKLDNCRLAGTGLGRLATLSELRELDLTFNQLTDDSLASLPSLPRLERLILRNNIIAGLGLQNVRRIAPHLTHLELSSNPLGREAIPELALLAPALDPGFDFSSSKLALEEVPRFAAGDVVRIRVCRDNFCGHNNAEFRFTVRRGNGGKWQCQCQRSVVAPWAQAIGGFRESESIEISNFAVRDEDILPLAGMSKLAHLTLQPTTKITERILSAITSCPALTELNLRNVRFLGEEKSPFAQNARLQSLVVSDGVISDQVMAGIAEASSISSLAFNRIAFSGNALRHIGKMTAVTQLDLSAVDLTDQDVAALGNLANVKMLSFADTSLNDRQIAHLAGMKKMTCLDIRNTRVSKEGLAALRSLPKLEYVKHCGSHVTDEEAQEFADQTGWTFAGECDCGCMDIVPQKQSRP